jgi:CBS domain containing-hemolysin-like protein
MNARRLKTYQFLEWLSSGTAAVSLALFIYTISLPKPSIYIAILFLVSMASSVSATAIAKEITAHEKITNKANILHATTLVIGCFSCLGGLGGLALAVNYWLLIALIVAFVIAWLAYLAAFNSLWNSP